MVQPVLLGELLQQYRAEAHLSQEELAERAGVSARTIGDIETGVSLRPHGITVSQIAQALELDSAAREALRFAASRRRASHVASGAQLPEAVTLVGREPEMSAVRKLLADPAVRLLTLTGSPGVGKTALAVATAHELAPEFADRVLFVEFSSLPDAVLVPTKIALAAGVRNAQAASIATSLAWAIGDRPMLMVLDNFERVAAAAPFVAELLAVAPVLKILATSRTLLHLSSEHVVTVGSLALPPGDDYSDCDALSTAPSIRLLLERVRVCAPDFRVDQHNALEVAALMRTLGGVPLAIELAAPLLRAASATELAARLERPLDVLVADRRHKSHRQGTMRGAIASSYELLGANEQRLLRRLAVFRAPFTEDAAQHVAAEDGTAADPLSTLRTLATLVDHSLISVSDDGSGEGLIELHALVGKFAAELLQRQGEDEAAYLRLTEYSTSLAHARLSSEAPPDSARQATLNRESSHFDAALGWLKSTGRLERAVSLAVALWPIWYRRGANAHGYTWVSTLLAAAAQSARPLDAGIRADAHWAASGLGLASGQLDHAERHVTCALPHKRALGDRKAVASLLSGAGVCASLKGRDTTARGFFEESLAIRRDLGDGLDIARSLLDLGTHLADEGEFAEATARLEEALVLFRAAQRKMGTSLVLGILAVVALRSGSPSRVEPLAREAICLAEMVGFPESVRAAKIVLCRALLEMGEIERAEALALDIATGEEFATGPAPDVVRVLVAIEYRRGRARRAARLLGAASGMRDEAVIPRVERRAHEALVAEVAAMLGSQFNAELATGSAAGLRAVLIAPEFRE